MRFCQRKRLPLCLAVTLCLCGLSGCFGLHLFSGGSGETKTETIKEREARTTTLGQELLDLDQAYKKGVLSKKEYAKAKKKLLEKYAD